MNKHQEARDIMKYALKHFPPLPSEVSIMVWELINRITPMKWEQSFTEEFYICPRCNATYKEVDEIKYCIECGQRLDK